MSKPETNQPKLTAKLADLDAAVEWFYSDDFSLDCALDHYEKAAQLAADVEKDLTGLKNQVEILEDFTK